MNLTNKLRRFISHQENAIPLVPLEPVNLDPFLQGEEVMTPFGVCYVILKTIPLTEKHGLWALHQTLQSEARNLQRLGEIGFREFSLEEALFLDTETTGLAGGTGTHAFLIGTGRFSRSHFVIKQFLMRDYNEEPAQLHLLDQELQKSDTIISFNGKTFDLPLLQTRSTLARLEWPVTTKHKHLDLLHLSRRLWRQKLDSCSLNSLERHILGVIRTDDIPGYEIPGRYFSFLQTGDGKLLADVVKHNLLDVLSMVTLLYHLQLTVNLSPEECDCPWEAEALAQLALRANKQIQALPYLEAARQLCQEPRQHIRLLRQTAFIHKRLGNHQTAARLWRQILNFTDDLTAYEELAKYYEHRSKDLLAADQITRRALAVAWQTKSTKIPSWEHRLRRIERKAHS